MLLFKPPIIEDECPVSYLLRISDHNGYRRINQLLKSAGFKWKNNRIPTQRILEGSYDINPLFKELDLPQYESTLLSEFCSQFKSIRDTDKIISTRPKVCPLCINDDGYAKGSWSLLPVTCCAKHKVMLVDYDYKNSKPLSWYRPHLGFYNSIEPIKTCKTAPSELILLSAIFDAYIHKSPLPKKTPKILLPLNGVEALTLLNFIAHYLAKLEGRSLKKTNLNIDTGQQYLKAFIVIVEWPTEFHKLLDYYIDNPMDKKRNTSGIRKHFRDLFDKLHRQRENAGVRVMLEEFNSYLEIKWPGLIDKNRISRLNLQNTKRTWIGAKEAARILKCRIPKINSLVKQGKLSEYSWHNRHYYSRAEVLKRSRLQSNNWTFKQTCKELSISKHKLYSLLRSNLISAIDKPDNYNRDWLIDKKSILSLFKKLRKKAVDSDSDGKKYSFEGFLKSGHTFDNTVKMMIEKKLEYRFINNESQPYNFQQFLDFKKPV